MIEPARGTFLVPPRGTVIPSLNGLRAASILVVFVGHSGLPLGVRGSTGVTVFFFLSGYLITTLLRREADSTGRIHLGAFYLRRAARILPPLYIVLAIGMGLTAVGWLPGELQVEGVLSAAFFWANYWLIHATPPLGLPEGAGVVWSLAVEEHFYLLFPLVLVLLMKVWDRRRQGYALLALCGGVLAWRCWLVFGADVPFIRVYYASDTRVDSLLLGCALALLANPYLDRIPGRDWVWQWVLGPLGIMVLLGTSLTSDRMLGSVGFTVQAAGLSLLFIAAVRHPWWGIYRLLNLRPVAYLGMLSYGFYLVHASVLGLIGGSQWTRAGIAFVVSVGAAFVLRVLIEKPSERVRRLLTPVSAPTGAPAARSAAGFAAIPVDASGR
jgi:peptidoglycan/LPS O-acetylase OafA/YrhL